MNGKNIFIVENERVVALDLSHRLERLGHKIVGNVASEKEALKQMEGIKADVVLTDIKLSGDGDGIELARIVQEKYGLPVIFITAYSDEQTLARVKASKACGFIIKPFTDEELQATIDIGLSEHELAVKLKQSEEQYRCLFDEAPVGYHEIDLKGKLVRVNRTEQEMLGYPAEKMIGRPVWDFLLDTGAARAGVLKKLETDEISSQPFERSYLRSDSRILTVLVQDYPLRNKAGRLKGIRSTIQNISQLKEEQTRRASFSDIVEKSMIGLLVISKDGYVRYINPAAERLLDCGEDALIGEKYGVPLEGDLQEVDMVQPNGERGVAEVRVMPTTWDEEQAFLISLYDITERKKVEKELKKIDEMKTDFVSMVSHELRTPLSITKEGISLVLDRVLGQINEKQTLILTAAKNNIDRLARIIDILLDVSKLEAGRAKLRPEWFDIVETVKPVVAGFEARAKEKNLKLRTIFSAERIRLYADHDKVIQIFTNLIANALKFTHKGGVKISVKDLKNTVECAVADTGIGISEDDLTKVFDRFQQFSRVDGPGEKGTGLGLYIVKGLVELHGGSIRVESRLKRGTKFIFVLPKSDKGKELEAKQPRKEGN